MTMENIPYESGSYFLNSPLKNLEFDGPFREILALSEIQFRPYIEFGHSEFLPENFRFILIDFEPKNHQDFSAQLNPRCGHYGTAICAWESDNIVLAIFMQSHCAGTNMVNAFKWAII
jgi:hypothetical protein